MPFTYRKLTWWMSWIMLLCNTIASELSEKEVIFYQAMHYDYLNAKKVMFIYSHMYFLCAQLPEWGNNILSEGLPELHCYPCVLPQGFQSSPTGLADSWLCLHVSPPPFVPHPPVLQAPLHVDFSAFFIQKQTENPYLIWTPKVS